MKAGSAAATELGGLKIVAALTKEITQNTAFPALSPIKLGH